MASLWQILNKENETEEDVESLQQKHQGFVFSIPDSQSPNEESSSSDIVAIQTLHALADMHSTIRIKKENEQRLTASAPSLVATKQEPPSPPLSSSSSSSSRKRSWDSYSPSSSPSSMLSSSSSNCSRRDYKKKQLVVKPELMQMKQAKAAVALGIPPSTFSKRWRESLPDRKWPYRIHKKVEKSIQMLKVLQNKGHDVTNDLKRLTTQRELNLKPAVITMFEDVNESFEIDTTMAGTTTTTTSSSSSSSSSSESTPSFNTPSFSPSSSTSSPTHSPVAQVPLGSSDEIFEPGTYNSESPIGVPNTKKNKKDINKRDGEEKGSSE